MDRTRFSDTDEVISDSEAGSKTPRKKEKRNKDTVGSDSDKESVASSQFLEQLLECDRLENGHRITSLPNNLPDTPLPRAFTSVKNYLLDSNTLPYCPVQRKTIEVTHSPVSPRKKKVLLIKDHCQNNEPQPLIVEPSSDLPPHSISSTDKMNYMNTTNGDMRSGRSQTRAQEKEDLKRINERFSSYIKHVRQLNEISNQVDSSAFFKSTRILEDEINSLKNLYESELDKLRSEIDELGKEKKSYQLQYNKSKQTCSELEVRLSAEMDRNRSLNDELNNYHQRIAGLEAELNSTRMAANEHATESEKLQRNIDNLTRESDTWKHRYEHEEQARQEDENKIQQLMKKLEFNDQVHAQLARDLQERLDSSASSILALEAKVRELGKADTDMGELLQQVREASDTELRKYQAESEEQLNRNMSMLRNQMDQDKQTMGQLSAEKNQLQNLVGELQGQIRTLEGQVSALNQQKLGLEDLVNQERNRAADQAQLLERKLQDLQDDLFSKIQEVNCARDANVPLKAEIESLKVLLEEEEKRLRLPLTSTLATKPLYPLTTTSTYNSKCMSPPSPLTPTAPYPPPSPNVYSTSPTKPYSPRTYYGSTSSALQDPLPYTAKSYEPFGTDVHTFLDEDITSADVLPPTERYGYMATPSLSHMQCESSPGPMGPTRAKSAPAHGRNAQLVPTSLGQGQDYFDEMFKDLAKDTLQAKLRPQTCPVDQSTHDYTVATSSSTGDIKVLEIQKDGKFIRLVNEAPKDIEFGGYMIQQNVGGHPVAVYRFPPRTKFGGNTTITVWSGMTDPIKHQPPTDFVWKEQQKWGTGPECTTILCKPNGQAVAWTTAAHRFTQNNYDVDSRNNTPDSLGEEGSLTDLPQDKKQDAVYLRREKQSPPSLSAQKHPHGTSPAIPTHPHNNGTNSYIPGGVTAYNNTTRSQTRPDLIMNAPVARVGSAPLRKSAAQQPSIKGNGILTNKPVNEGRTSTPPSAFMKPKSRLSTGLNQVQSQHHSDFLPPMPRPPLNSVW